MNLRGLASRFFPDSIKEFIRERNRKKEQQIFDTLNKLTCKTDKLKKYEEGILQDIFNSEEIDYKWRTSKKEISRFEIPDGTGGVNPGDRKALYYLISYLKPTNVLEIGTHIGASTIHIASALFYNKIQKGEEAHLSTLDIRDVNSNFEKPWLEYRTQHSPKEMLEQLGYQHFVNFITDKSLNYLKKTNQNFDFIFLDGLHTASTVYQEIPAALKVLKNDGVILLHDYFPNNEPLWDEDNVISGPYLAVERLRKEGANIKALPLGKLPWKTKLNSNVTSLALLLKNK